jgi:DNA-binding transcriptional ArsR family regulator
MKEPLKRRLLNFLRSHYTERWIPSGELQRIVATKTRYTPQNVGRRLRELENERLIEVRYERNHAHYRATPVVSDLAEASIRWFDDLVPATH